MKSSKHRNCPCAAKATRLAVCAELGDFTVRELGDPATSTSYSPPDVAMASKLQQNAARYVDGMLTKFYRVQELVAAQPG